mmetsp:Transcript_51100/g.143882  ORF Transcript_51100/g.143882 Transcript_51100/m.143882 type:complete len:269 (-) Transcript_51100:1996-2802(-)
MWTKLRATRALTAADAAFFAASCCFQCQRLWPIPLADKSGLESSSKPKSEAPSLAFLAEEVWSGMPFDLQDWWYFSTSLNAVAKFALKLFIVVNRAWICCVNSIGDASLQACPKYFTRCRHSESVDEWLTSSWHAVASTRRASMLSFCIGSCWLSSSLSLTSVVAELLGVDTVLRVLMRFLFDLSSSRPAGLGFRSAGPGAGAESGAGAAGAAPAGAPKPTTLAVPMKLLTSSNAGLPLMSSPLKPSARAVRSSLIHRSMSTLEDAQK